MSYSDTLEQLFAQLDQGHVEAIDEIFSADFVDHRTDGDYDRRVLAPEARAFARALSGCTRRIDLLLEEGPLVAYRAVLSGTLTGPYTYPEQLRTPKASKRVPPRPIAVPPAGKPLRLVSTAIMRFDEAGLCCERWLCFDRVELFAQLAGQRPRKFADATTAQWSPQDRSSPGPYIDRDQQLAAAEKFIQIPADRSIGRSDVLEFMRPEYVHHVNGRAPVDLDSLLGRQRDAIIGAVSKYSLSLTRSVSHGNWLAAVCHARRDARFDGVWTWPDGSRSRGNGEQFVEMNMFMFHFADDGRIDGDYHSADLLSALAQFDI